MSRFVGNAIAEGTGTGNRYRSRGYRRGALRVLGGAAVLTLAATVAGCAHGSSGSASAANTASSSAMATKDAYAVATNDIGRLVAACTSLGSEGEAVTAEGGNAGVPTTQDFYDRYAVTAAKGLTAIPDVEKAQCSTDDGGISGHNQTGQRWTMAEVEDSQGDPEVIVEHADDSQVYGTSVLRPGSTDMPPVTQAYTFLNGLIEGAHTTP